LEAYADDVVSKGFRSQAAFVDGKIVGASALLSLQLTVPGLRQIPMGGGHRNPPPPWASPGDDGRDVRRRP
jgi:hypothetical protein